MMLQPAVMFRNLQDYEAPYQRALDSDPVPMYYVSHVAVRGGPDADIKAAALFLFRSVRLVSLFLTFECFV